MDKKKVIDILNKVYDNIPDDPCDFGIIIKQKITKYIKEVLLEINKPDWVSVEKELPEYWEKVWVTDKEHPNHVWISHREDEKSHRKQDKNGFPLWKFSYPYYEVTHWRKIDKLEV